MSADEVGYAEQEDAVRTLSRHYTGGRLDVAAFDDRVRAARSATTRAGIAALFADLPDPHPDLLRTPAPEPSGAMSGAAGPGTTSTPASATPGADGSPADAVRADPGTTRATSGTAAGGSVTSRLSGDEAVQDRSAHGPADADATRAPSGTTSDGSVTSRIPVGDVAADPSGHPAAGPFPQASPTQAWPSDPAGLGTGWSGFAGRDPGPGAGTPWVAGHPSPDHDGHPGATAYGAAAATPWYGSPGPAAYGPGSYGAPGGPYGSVSPGGGAYGSTAYGPAAYPPHPGPPAYGAYGVDPAAPYGREPYSGLPYSDKQKIVAGLLQLFLPFGVGRFYTGHAGLAVAQLLVTLFTFGMGAIWPFIDGIVLLAGRPTDPMGRPLRP